jgi:hypothetical protein
MMKLMKQKRRLLSTLRIQRMTKPDCCIFFKEPVAQVHWSNLYGVLNRAELDARRTDGPLSDAANALSCLARNLQ